MRTIKNEATLCVEFDEESNALGGNLKALLKRKGAASELVKLRFGFTVKRNGRVIVKKAYPRDYGAHDAPASLFVPWKAGDKISVVSWIRGPGGTHLGISGFRVPAAPAGVA